MKIKVKDAVLTAAQMLGIDEGVASFLEGGDNADGERDTKILLRCFYTVENELALDYLPLTAEDTLITTTGKVEYTKLTRAAVRVLCVEDEWGEGLKYKLFPDHIQTQAGKVKIVYAYAPSEKTIEGESDYKTGASLRLFGYGMAAEYALASGELTAASAWDSKYKDAVRAAYRLFPCKRIRSRRWV